MYLKRIVIFNELMSEIYGRKIILKFQEIFHANIIAVYLVLWLYLFWLNNRFNKIFVYSFFLKCLRHINGPYAENSNRI